MAPRWSRLRKLIPNMEVREIENDDRVRMFTLFDKVNSREKAAFKQRDDAGATGQ